MAKYLFNVISEVKLNRYFGRNQTLENDQTLNKLFFCKSNLKSILDILLIKKPYSKGLFD